MSGFKRSFIRSGRVSETSVGQQSGLSLLELLVVVAILSILVMVATPMYQAHVIKTKVGGEFPLMGPVKEKVYLYYAVNNGWPVSNSQAAARPPSEYSGSYLQSVAVTDDPVAGSIVLTYNTDSMRPLIGQNTIIYYPVLSNGRVKWACDKGTMPSQYRPGSCS